MVWIDTGIRSGDSRTSVVATVANRSVLLVRAGGTWWAVDNLCSHAGCTFDADGEIDGTAVICNCHGSEFDLRTGQVLAPPADEPLASHPTRVASGRVEVDI
jgi:nitrite reductase/ring-hydroxylating ferredoxin subunit